MTEVPEEWENILLDAISHRALLGMTTKDDGLIAFDDSGLKLRYGNNRTAWMAQALHFRREYIVAAKAKQLRFPSMRGARAGYGM